MTDKNPRPSREVRVGLHRFYGFTCFAWMVFCYGRFKNLQEGVGLDDLALIVGVPLSVPAFLYFGLGVARHFTGRKWPDWW